MYKYIGKKNIYKIVVYIKVIKNIFIEVYVIYYFIQVKYVYKEQYIEEKLYL